MSASESTAEVPVTRIGLVLGAGGATGFAFHAGVLAAMEVDTGWDPRTAEVIVGTSAGASIAGMLRAGVTPRAMLDRQAQVATDPETIERLTRWSNRLRRPSARWRQPAAPGLAFRELSRPWRMRPGHVGAALLPRGEESTERIGLRQRSLHGSDWPKDVLWICAVRLRDGERTVFGQGEQITDVGTAAEASSAIPGVFTPVEIGDDEYVDGGLHSPTNADLLSDQRLDLVVVLAPMSSRRSASRTSADAALRAWSAARLDRELVVLRRKAHRVLVLEPDAELVKSMGPNAMNPTRIATTIAGAPAFTQRIHTHARNSDALRVLATAAESQTSPPERSFPAT